MIQIDVEQSSVDIFVSGSPTCVGHFQAGAYDGVAKLFEAVCQRQEVEVQQKGLVAVGLRFLNGYRLPAGPPLRYEVAVGLRFLNGYRLPSPSRSAAAVAVGLRFLKGYRSLFRVMRVILVAVGLRFLNGYRWSPQAVHQIAVAVGLRFLNGYRIWCH